MTTHYSFPDPDLDYIVSFKIPIYLWVLLSIYAIAALYLLCSLISRFTTLLLNRDCCDNQAEVQGEATGFVSKIQNWSQTRGTGGYSVPNRRHGFIGFKKPRLVNNTRVNL